MIKIAMRCTQEDFDSIKDRIEYNEEYIDNFERNPYLVNNYNYLQLTKIAEKLIGL